MLDGRRLATQYLVALWLCGSVTVFDLHYAAVAAESRIENSTAQKDVEGGWAAFQKGDLEMAVTSWMKAAQTYGAAKQNREQAEVLTYLAHAYQLLGHYKSSEKSLAAALILTEKSSDRSQQATVIDAVGNLYLAIGQHDRAQQNLNEGLRIAKEIGNRPLTASILNNLGNLLVAQQKHEEALESYSESARLAEETDNWPLAAKAWVNAGMASMDSGDAERAVQLLETGVADARALPASYDKVNALINSALAYEKLGRQNAGNRDSLILTSFTVLKESLRAAETIGDRRGESYGLGYLGQLYEGEKRYDDALTLTRRAIFAAQQVNSREALYRWQWQTGRLLRAQGKIDEAISAFRQAVRDLQAIRQELSLSYGVPRVSFRDSVGRIYFEMVDLLLSHPTVLQDQTQAVSFLDEARQTIEIFKQAELRDYFKDDCVDAVQGRIAKLDIVAPRAVVVYPIVLPDRLELLINTSGKLRKVTVPVNEGVLTKEVRQFRINLEKKTTYDFLISAQKLYNWIIRPIEKHLTAATVDTLVFVPDGALRTIPMAALHDGEKYLIEKYPVAVTPGLDLTDPRPLRREKVRMLSMGLSKAVQGYAALPYVSGEIDAIQRIYGGQQLLNEEYTMSRVEKELKDGKFNVVHIASHGEFSNEIEKTYLLTFDDRLTMDRLDQFVGFFRFRDDPLELITLSACETAAGDDRAALGLAGIAVKAGARSALATLWLVNDQAASELIEDFYKQLNDESVSRAVALQLAQTKLLQDRRYDHPGYWSPFLLINNWL